jgi:hypothetical protein
MVNFYVVVVTFGTNDSHINIFFVLLFFFGRQHLYNSIIYTDSKILCGRPQAGYDQTLCTAL